VLTPFGVSEYFQHALTEVGGTHHILCGPFLVRRPQIENLCRVYPVTFYPSLTYHTPLLYPDVMARAFSIIHGTTVNL